MSIEVGISKIYNFIKGDMSKLDLNNDGKITETETYYCLLDNANEWNNEDIEGESNDIIKNFWNRLNFNKCGENCVMLDNKEIDKFNNRIEVYEKFEQYFDEKIKTNIPNELINDNYDNKWFHEAKEILLGYVETFLKKGGKEGELEAFLQGTANDQSIYEKTGKYKNLEQYAMNKATFAVYTEQYIQTNICDNGYNGFGYVDLSKIVEEMSHKIGDVDINGNPQTINDVITLVQEKVGDYVSRASGSYEFKEEEKNDQINEFQRDVLVHTSNEKMKDIKLDICSQEDADLLNAAKVQYEEEMKGTLNGQFNERLALTSNDIYNSNAFRDVRDLNDARKIPDSFWNSLPTDIQLSVGDANDYYLPTKYQVQSNDGKTKWIPDETNFGQLEFRASDGTYADVAPSGKITLKGGNQVGEHYVTIGVYLNGHYVKNMPQQIKITTKRTSHDKMIQNLGNFSSEESENDISRLFSISNNLRIFGSTTYNDCTRLPGQNLTTLYNENAIIELYNDGDKGDFDTHDAAERFEALCDGILKSMYTSIPGVNYDILYNAVIQIRDEWLNYMWNYASNEDCSTYGETDGYNGDEMLRRIRDDVKAGTVGNRQIITLNDCDGADEWAAAISVRGLLDAIFQRFEDLGGNNV